MSESEDDDVTLDAVEDESVTPEVAPADDAREPGDHVTEESPAEQSETGSTVSTRWSTSCRRRSTFRR